ncbi:hypothetical protein R1flu_000966 [Riccia fluitans]|uniref:Uncharacterized protein n=1 Tax=Riccia fluitans TaxID=41844 RepID=A0ABD1Y2A4_9MARC
MVEPAPAIRAAAWINWNSKLTTARRSWIAWRFGSERCGGLGGLIVSACCALKRFSIERSGGAIVTRVPQAHRIDQPSLEVLWVHPRWRCSRGCAICTTMDLTTASAPRLALPISLRC